MNITVKVLPKSSKNAIVGYEKGVLKVKITAAPEKGDANRALIEFLGRFFNIKKSFITILKGETSRLKVIQIEGLTEEQLASCNSKVHRTS